MARLMYQLEGVRGRTIAIYDRKCVIATKPSVGSLMTGNISDGVKTIFYTDVVGVQFKRSGNLIGYLQFETGSVQMNNQNSNMFSENTFTFEHGRNGVTNEQMEAIYNQVCDLIEAIKYGDDPARIAVSAVMPTVLSCPKCGRPVPPDSKFCVGCGERLG